MNDKYRIPTQPKQSESLIPPKKLPIEFDINTKLTFKDYKDIIDSLKNKIDKKRSKQDGINTVAYIYCPVFLLIFLLSIFQFFDYSYTILSIIIFGIFIFFRIYGDYTWRNKLDKFLKKLNKKYQYSGIEIKRKQKTYKQNNFFGTGPKERIVNKFYIYYNNKLNNNNNNNNTSTTSSPRTSFKKTQQPYDTNQQFQNDQKEPLLSNENN